MRNRFDGWKAESDNSTLSLPISYDDDDNLVCSTPKGDIKNTEADDETSFQDLLAGVHKLGYRVFGCFSCRYFCAMSDQDARAAGMGYCLEGKLGKHMNFRVDKTSLFASCDAYLVGTETDREREKATWAESLPKW
jgi:hypothetical protein